MTHLKKFALDLALLPKEELMAKYSSKDFDISIIPMLLREIKSQGNLRKFVNDDPKWDPGDINVYVVEVSPGLFEYFETERGGRHCRQTFSNLEEAVRRKLEAIFVGLGD